MTPQTSNSIPKLTTDFVAAAPTKPQNKRRMAPLSVRLSKVQRVQLEQDAAGIATSLAGLCAW